MPEDSNRRRFLKKSLLTGSLIGIAGCQGQDNGDSDSGDGSVGGDGTATPMTDAPAPESDVEYEEVREMNWVSVSRQQNPQRYEWGVLSRQNLQRLGFRFDTDVVEIGTWSDRLFAREWDFFHLGWSGSIERIFPYYNLFFSFHSQFAEIGEGNFQLWSSDEYDTTVENFIAAIDDEERQQLAYKCQEIIGENEPVVFTHHPSALVAHDNQNWEGWEEMFGNFAYWNLNTIQDVSPTGNSDSLVYGTTRSLQNFPNFFTVTGPVALMVYKMFYDSVAYLDYSGQPYPLAAEDWEYQDSTTLDVTLREGMQFHDGEEVTAEDLKTTWDLMSEYEIPYLSSDVGPYESSEIRDDYTVRFNLNEPFSGFVQISLFRVPILPAHIWGNVVEEEGLEHPREWSDPDLTGSGLFEMEEYESGNRILFTLNENHRLAENVDFTTLVYNIYGNESAIIGDIANGNTQFAQRLAPNQWNRADQSSSIGAVENPNLQANGIWVQCNGRRHRMFEDVGVRRAIAHAVDDQQQLDIVYQGHGEQARSCVAPVNEFYYNSDTTHYETNVGKARDILADLGFRWNDRGRIMIPTEWEPETTYVPVE
jgi:peptide/nickel transport system substrate-binding protein